MTVKAEALWLSQRLCVLTIQKTRHHPAVARSRQIKSFARACTVSVVMEEAHVRSDGDRGPLIEY